MVISASREAPLIWTSELGPYRRDDFARLERAARAGAAA